MYIEFENKLPSMYDKDGNHNGIYNNPEIGYPGVLTVKDPRLGEFMHTLRNVVYDDRRLVFIDKKRLMCSNNWLRDYVHQMKAFKHWEYDNESFLRFMLENQTDEGFFYELIKQIDDRHWSFVHEDCRKMYPEDNLSLVRLEIEADVEYLAVEGVLQCYRVSGDLGWVKEVLPRLEKAINYITSSPKRWDEAHGLAKRAFTIDTWDFTYGKCGKNRKIEEDTPMAIMHGDNSGLFDAMNTLAYFRRLLGEEDKAKAWEKRAEKVRENMMKHLWNGKFFVHQLHLNSDGADGLEAERLSLSNTYDINRGVTSLSESRSIIEEYMRRKETTSAFAEWFSIDPPYADFKGYEHTAGHYVNGAISPFTAGELAKAAFRCGYEEYGYDILTRLRAMTERDGTICFLYGPEDGLPQGGGPSAWGAAAILSAIDEGLAGIEDTSFGYRSIRFSPRFPVTEYKELRYFTGYEKTGADVNVKYILTDSGMRYDLVSPAKSIEAHFLLPKGKECRALYVSGEKKDFTSESVADSRYAGITVCPGDAGKAVCFEILFE